jgi:hypothetical protein
MHDVELIHIKTLKNINIMYINRNLISRIRPMIIYVTLVKNTKDICIYFSNDKA